MYNTNGKFYITNEKLYNTKKKIQLKFYTVQI